MRQAIRALAGVVAEPGSNPPAVEVRATAPRDGYQVETISLHSDAGMELPGLAAIPARAGPRPAVLVLDSLPDESVVAAGDDLDRLAQAGRLVMVLRPRPTPPGTIRC